MTKTTFVASSCNTLSRKMETMKADCKYLQWYSNQQTNVIADLVVVSVS